MIHFSPSATDVIKTRLEFQIRSQAIELGKNDSTSTDNVQNLLDFTFSLAKEDFCAKSLTVSILQDIFDVSSKRKCEEFFAVVEKSIVEWKTVIFSYSKSNEEDFSVPIFRYMQKHHSPNVQRFAQTIIPNGGYHLLWSRSYSTR